MRRFVLLGVLPVLALSLVLGGAPARAHQHEAGDLVVTHPWARATVAVQKNGAAYMTIRNRGREPDRLLAVRTGEARSAELHGSTVTVEGVAQMRPTEGLEIPPGGEVKLVPSGLHVMLVGLKGPLFEGVNFPMTLVFERTGEVEVDVEVTAPGTDGQHNGHGAGHEATGHAPSADGN